MVVTCGDYCAAATVTSYDWEGPPSVATATFYDLAEPPSVATEIVSCSTEQQPSAEKVTAFDGLERPPSVAAMVTPDGQRTLEEVPASDTDA